MDKAVAEYDSIAEEYASIKTCPLKMYCEEYTTWSILGDVEGLSILDIACGDGYYARPLCKKGARVTAIDLSEEQIARGRRKNGTEFDISYHAADAFEIPSLELGEFDVVMAYYMMPYCKDKEDLQKICSIAASSLKQGGRFINITPLWKEDMVLNSKHLGIELTVKNKTVSEDVILGVYKIYSLDRATGLSLPAHFWSKEAISEALSATGFKFDWVDMQIHPDGKDWFSSEEAQDHLKRRSAEFCVATKL